MNLFTSYSLEDTLRVFLALVIVLSGVIAVGYCIWGGFLLIMSGGNEEKVKPAVNHIRHAVIGLVALLATLFLIPKVLTFFGSPYGAEIEPSRIFQTMSELSGHIFENSTPLSIDPNNSSGPSELPSDFSEL